MHTHNSRRQRHGLALALPAALLLSCAFFLHAGCARGWSVCRRPRCTLQPTVPLWAQPSEFEQEPAPPSEYCNPLLQASVEYERGTSPAGDRGKQEVHGVHPKRPKSAPPR